MAQYQATQETTKTGIPTNAFATREASRRIFGTKDRRPLKWQLQASKEEVAPTYQSQQEVKYNNKQQPETGMMQQKMACALGHHNKQARQLFEDDPQGS